MSTRVIITGAASGIGAATVAELRSRGAQVVGLDLNGDEDAGILACDVRDQDAVDRAVSSAVERLGGGVDVLVNCAGIGIPQSAGYAVLSRLPRRLIDRAMRANVRRMARQGAFDGSQLASDFAARQRSG